MEMCPLCQSGQLTEVRQSDTGETRIQCSNYPRCRFDARDWTDVEGASARFHHPVSPGCG